MGKSPGISNAYIATGCFSWFVLFYCINWQIMGRRWIGKLWGDGGLRDLLVDSGVYAAATVDQMSCGKQLNRALRGLTLCYEALKSLFQMV